MKLYVYKVNVFVDGDIISICKRLNSFFSSETQKKICPEILLVEDILLVENDTKKLA